MKRDWPPLFLQALAHEEEVEEREGAYRGLDPRALYTSAADMAAIMEVPLVQGTWVDLGSGLGFTCLAYAIRFPERRAIGVEFSRARHHGALGLRDRLGVANVDFRPGDLMDVDLPTGDTYFLYFPTGPVLDRILSVLHQRGGRFRLVAIESHGDLLARLSKEEWLRELGRMPITSQRHGMEAVIYQAEEGPRGKGVAAHEVSFLERYLVIEDENGERWLGDSFGLEWLHGRNYQLRTPPRTIRWDQVKEVRQASDLAPELARAVAARKRGRLNFTTAGRGVEGEIRKIFLEPLEVELSGGERLAWGDVRGTS